MSLTLSPIRKKVVIEETVNLDAPRSYLIEKGGNTSTFQPVSTQNASNSQITWTIVVPNIHTCVDRLMYVRVPVRFIITGTVMGGGSNLISPEFNSVALRAYPLTSCMSAVSVQINNTTINATPYYYVSAFQRARIYQHDTNIGMSSYPSLPDNSQYYIDYFGSPRNVLGNALNGNFYQSPRGDFPLSITNQTLNGGVVTTVLDTIITEPLFLSPFLYSPKQEQPGLFYVTQLNIQMQLTNLERMLSIDTNAQINSGSTITSVIGNIVNGSGTLPGGGNFLYYGAAQSGPQVLLRYITPDIVMPIPKEIYYAYENIVVYQTSQGSGPIGGTSYINGLGLVSNTASSNSLQFNQIPTKIYIYLQRSQAQLNTNSQGYKYTDCFASIWQISINFNNLSGILSSATQHDLWKMSVRNGINISWPDWNGGGMATNNTTGPAHGGYYPIGVGSILCIKPAYDFGLPSDLAPGVYGEQFNFSCIVNFYNIGVDVSILADATMANPSYNLFVVPVYDGILTLTESTNALQQLGTLTKQDILSAPRMERVAAHEAMSPWGGDFFGDLGNLTKKVFNKVTEVAQDAAPYLEKGAKVAASVAPYLPLIGLGGEMEGGRMASKGEMGRQMMAIEGSGGRARRKSKKQ